MEKKKKENQGGGRREESQGKPLHPYLCVSLLRSNSAHFLNSKTFYEFLHKAFVLGLRLPIPSCLATFREKRELARKNKWKIPWTHSLSVIWSKFRVAVPVLEAA